MLRLDSDLLGAVHSTDYQNGWASEDFSPRTFEIGHFHQRHVAVVLFLTHCLGGTVYKKIATDFLQRPVLFETEDRVQAYR